jgi:uncharacterized C2H2 Zn-finger protein
MKAQLWLVLQGTQNADLQEEHTQLSTCLLRPTQGQPPPLPLPFPHRVPLLYFAGVIIMVVQQTITYSWQHLALYDDRPILSSLLFDETRSVMLLFLTVTNQVNKTHLWQVETPLLLTDQVNKTHLWQVETPLLLTDQVNKTHLWQVETPLLLTDQMNKTHLWQVETPLLLQRLSHSAGAMDSLQAEKIMGIYLGTLKKCE